MGQFFTSQGLISGISVRNISLPSVIFLPGEMKILVFFHFFPFLRGRGVIYNIGNQLCPVTLEQISHRQTTGIPSCSSGGDSGTIRVGSIAVTGC